jgi:hypothetical protein
MFFHFMAKILYVGVYSSVISFEIISLDQIHYLVSR